MKRKWIFIAPVALYSTLCFIALRNRKDNKDANKKTAEPPEKGDTTHEP